MPQTSPSQRPDIASQPPDVASHPPDPAPPLDVGDLLDELDSIRPDLGHPVAQESVDAALEAARDVLELWR